MRLQQARKLQFILVWSHGHNAAGKAGTVYKRIFIMLARTYNHSYARKPYAKRCSL